MLTFRLAVLLLLQGITIPQPVGYVNDFARVIDAASAARINAIVNDVKVKSGGEIVVVTLPDIKDRPIEDVSRQIGRDWKVGLAGKIGDKAKNTGTIILVVPKETSSDGRGHLRIETGNGSEGFLTDATTGAIQDEALDRFRAGDYGGGIELMTARVAERYAGEFNFTLDPSSQVAQPAPVQRRQRTSGGINPVTIFIIFMIILSIMGRGRRRRGCLPIFLPMGGGGFGGGGFGGGGFGGGGFGGGGGGGFGGFGGGGGFSGGGSSRSW